MTTTLRYIKTNKNPLHLMLKKPVLKFSDRVKREVEKFWEQQAGNNFNETRFVVVGHGIFNGRYVFILDQVPFSYIYASRHAQIPDLGHFTLANGLSKLVVNDSFVAGKERASGKLTSFSGHIDKEDFDLKLPNGMDPIAPLLANGNFDNTVIKAMVASLDEAEKSGTKPETPGIKNVMRETEEESGIVAIRPAGPIGIMEMSINGIPLEFWPSYDLETPFNTQEEIKAAFESYDQNLQRRGLEREIEELYFFGISPEELKGVLNNGEDRRPNFDPAIVASLKFKGENLRNTPYSRSKILDILYRSRDLGINEFLKNRIQWRHRKLGRSQPEIER